MISSSRLLACLILLLAHLHSLIMFSSFFSPAFTLLYPCHTFLSVSSVSFTSSFLPLILSLSLSTSTPPFCPLTSSYFYTFLSISPPLFLLFPRLLVLLPVKYRFISYLFIYFMVLCISYTPRFLSPHQVLLISIYLITPLPSLPVSLTTHTSSFNPCFCILAYLYLSLHYL